jgi:hypothetical protein
MNGLEWLLLASILLSWLVASMVLRWRADKCHSPVHRATGNANLGQHPRTAMPSALYISALNDGVFRAKVGKWGLGKFSQVAALLRFCTARTDFSPCIVIGAVFDVKFHHY